MLWAVICWGPAIHVDATLAHTNYVHIAADHAYSEMKVFPAVCALSAG